MIPRMLSIKIRDSFSGVTIIKRFNSTADIMTLLELFIKLNDNLVIESEKTDT